MIGNDNELRIGKNTLLKHTSIEIFGAGNSVIIEDECCLNYAILQVFGNNGCIYIGKNSIINGIQGSKTRFCCGGG